MFSLLETSEGPNKERVCLKNVEESKGSASLYEGGWASCKADLPVGIWTLTSTLSYVKPRKATSRCRATQGQGPSL